jgi:Sugar-transfer associated ATP-grasp
MTSETLATAMTPVQPRAVSTPAPRGVRRVLTAALGARGYRALRQAQWAAVTEYRDARFTWAEKLWAWRRGFLADSALLYDFPRNDWREYLSDYVRENGAATLNPVPQFFDQKLMLRALLLRHGFAQAETFALIGRLDAQLDPLGPDRRLASLADVEDAMRADGGRFIVKPQDSGFGYGVALVESRDGALVRQRGHRVSAYRVTPSRSTTLVERVIAQHPFWAELFPESCNTMRLLTLWTPGDPAPFIATAAQRVGASDTAPTDNFHGGGMAAPIRVETGELGRAVRHTPSGRYEWLSQHPESGARIEGARLPHWDAIQRTVLQAASALGLGRYVGWDVVVDTTGTPVIIEGNANTGVHILQLDRGLLSSPEVRRFYTVCGVL